ncbi:hypothetical protein ACFQ0G_21690 [Streptomyces chiangmaiensis]
MADGRELGARQLRSLENAAGGSGRVKTFCKGVLGGEDRRDDGDARGSDKEGDGRGHRGNDEGDRVGDHGGDDEGHIGPGDIGPAPFPPATSHVPAPDSPGEAPSPRPQHGAPGTAKAH